MECPMFDFVVARRRFVRLPELRRLLSVACLATSSVAGAASSSSMTTTTITTPPLGNTFLVPETYRALVADEVGASFADVARVRTAKVPPTLGEGEVLVRVAYAGVNGGCETFRARGEHAFAEHRSSSSPRPFRLGAEGVGTVVAVGGDGDSDGDGGASVGDAACFVGAAFGEYAVCPARTLWRLPPSATPTAEHVGLRVSALTSFAMLEGRIREGDVVLVTAAAGGAGHFAVQRAKMAGCTVIGTTSSATKARVLREKLGCDHVVNYKETPDVRREILNISPNGVDVAFEGVGGTMFRTALDVLKPKGSLIQVGYISEYPHAANNDDDVAPLSLEGASSLADLFWNQKTVRRGEQTIYGNGWPKDVSIMKIAKEKVLKAFEEGTLISLVDDEKKFVGLESIVPAVQHMLSGTTVGKVVVKITED